MRVGHALSQQTLHLLQTRIDVLAEGLHSFPALALTGGDFGVGVGASDAVVDALVDLVVELGVEALEVGVELELLGVVVVV